MLSSLRHLVIASLLVSCQVGGTITGKVVDPMTSQPRAGLRVVANANPESGNPQCQMMDATTGADGSFTIKNTCPATSYDLILKDGTLLIAGDSKAAGGGAVGPMTLEAWRAPADKGVFILKGDKLTAVKTAADIDSETISGGTETVFYPTVIPAKPTVVEPGSFLVVSGKELVDGLKFQPLVPHEGTLRFPTGADTYVDIPNHAYIGTKFKSDTEFERVPAGTDETKVKDVAKEDKVIRYYPSDALAEGRYVMMRGGDKRIYVFDWGKAAAPEATAAATPAAEGEAEGATAEGDPAEGAPAEGAPAEGAAPQ